MQLHFNIEWGITFLKLNTMLTNYNNTRPRLHIKQEKTQLSAGALTLVVTYIILTILEICAM